MTSVRGNGMGDSGAALRITLCVTLLSGCGATEIKPLALGRIPSDLDISSVWYLKPQFTPTPDYTQPPPLAFEDRLYYADRPNEILALDAQNGRSIWRAELKSPVRHGERPALSTGLGAGNGLIVAGTRQGYLIALDLASGAHRWDAQLSSEVTAPAVVSGAIVLARTDDGRIHALAATDGHVLWSYSSTVPPLSLHGAARLLVDRGKVYVGLANGKLVALNLATGEEIWEVAVGEPQGRSEFERLVDVNADPVLIDDVLYAAAYQARIVAIATTSGRIQWSRDVSTYQGLLIEGDTLYAATDQGAVVAINRANGAVVWRQDQLVGRRLTAPVLSEGRIVLADEQGFIHWLSPEDGRILARSRLADGAIPSAPVAGRGILYVADTTGALQALKVAQRR
jgi:outer membrane protein assembly factor BamB